MKANIISSILFLLLLAVTPVASSKDVPNLEQVELYGVSIGDSEEEVLKGLTEYFSISLDELEILTTYGENPKITHIDYQGDGFLLTTFHDKLSDTDKTLVLVNVRVDYDPIISKDSDIVKTMIDKYGKPSLSFARGERFTHFWCERVHSDGDRCDESLHTLTISNKTQDLWFARGG